MTYLNLDTAFQPFGKGIDFEHFTFHGGEPHIRILEKHLGGEEVTIATRIRSFNDLGLLLLAKDALARLQVEKVHLILPCFPAARQDRVMQKGEPLSVKVYAQLINTANFASVTILDPHSEVTSALLNNVRVISNHQFVQQCLLQCADYQLVAPDVGALKKAYQLAKFLGGKEVLVCNKKRDTSTGKLSGFTVYADDLQGKTCVLVDDICDGGGTFIGLAKELKKKGAGHLILIVTHGIFSKGFEELAAHFQHIYTTNSFADVAHSLVTQIPLDERLLFA